jgi:hypothetical protein
MDLNTLPKFTYCNGTELSAKLCYFYKQSKNMKFMLVRKHEGGRKEVKRILVLVGKIYDIIVRDGCCNFVRCWYDTYRHKTINDAPICLLKDSIQVLRKFLNVRLDNRCGNMLIIGKYGVLKPLMLVWKKGSMQGFPRDVIRYLSQWL